MSLGKALLTLIAATAWAGIAAAEEPAAVAHPEQLGFAPERLRHLTEVYQGFVDRGELPGAVLLIARGDRIAYFEAVGLQDRDKQVAMRKDALFRLASMTKPIVSVAAMMLVEDGRLDLLAPVAKYLPECKDLKVGVARTDLATGKTVLALEPQRRPMTVQDLLRHTSGLVYGRNGDGPVYQAYQKAGIGNRGDTLAEFVAKLARLPLAHQPGEVWEYGVSTDVLGRLAEAQKPPPGSDARMPPDVTHKPNFLSGGGGLVASAADYLHFAEMLLNRGEYGKTRLLAPHTVGLMTADALPPGIKYADLAVRFGDIAPTPEMGQGFGLGFAVRTAEGYNPLPGSVGTFYWTGAWGTTFWVDPREHLIAIQMIQTPTGKGGPYRRVFRELSYAALTGSEPER